MVRTLALKPKHLQKLVNNRALPALSYTGIAGVGIEHEPGAGLRIREGAGFAVAPLVGAAVLVVSVADGGAVVSGVFEVAQGAKQRSCVSLRVSGGE